MHRAVLWIGGHVKNDGDCPAGGAQIRMSDRLPLDYAGRAFASIWLKEKPKLVVMHLFPVSSVEPFSEDRDESVMQTSLRSFGAFAIKHSMYCLSRWFLGSDGPYQSLPPDLRESYVGAKRIFLAPINGNARFWRDERVSGCFQDGFSRTCFGRGRLVAVELRTHVQTYAARSGYADPKALKKKAGVGKKGALSGFHIPVSHPA